MHAKVCWRKHFESFETDIIWDSFPVFLMTSDDEDGPRFDSPSLSIAANFTTIGFIFVKSAHLGYNFTNDKGNFR